MKSLSEVAAAYDRINELAKVASKKGDGVKARQLLMSMKMAFGWVLGASAATKAMDQILEIKSRPNPHEWN